MSDQQFIGIDSGTQGTKGVVFSRGKGRILAEAYADHQLLKTSAGGVSRNPAGGLKLVRPSSNNC